MTTELFIRLPLPQTQSSSTASSTTGWRKDAEIGERVPEELRLPVLSALKNKSAHSIWEFTAQIFKAFNEASSLFVKHPGGRTPEIWAANEDWFFEPWGRDTFISLPGLLITPNRLEEAREIFRSFGSFQKNGLIPNRIWDTANKDSAEYNTSDASLWFIQSLKKYVTSTGDWDFAMEMLPVVRAVIAGYENGTGYFRHNRFNAIGMDPSDGLVITPAQSTWMDADPGGMDNPVTPRNGKAVEINALWYSDLNFFTRLLERTGNSDQMMTHYSSLADKVKVSFNAKFWNGNLKVPGVSDKRENALFDVIEGDPHGGAIRPNMIFAISNGDDLLSPERQKAVLKAVTTDLLTPYGLRTLSPRDSYYKGRYYTDKPQNEKDQAYHQGTVWPWLIGAYVDALCVVMTNEGASKNEMELKVREILEPLVLFLFEHGSLPEVFDGDIPQHPGGTHSQAWSVAEVFRVLVEHGGIGTKYKKTTSTESTVASEDGKIESSLIVPSESESHMTMLQTFREIAKIGTLTEIQSMDPFKFAELMGAKEVPPEEINFFLLVECTAITPEHWQSIVKKRASGNLGTWSESILENTQEINGPGIYYSKGGMENQAAIGHTKVTTTSFAHELFEMTSGQLGLVDKHWVHTLHHHHFVVLEGELRFASLMGADELATRQKAIREQLRSLKDTEENRSIRQQVEKLLEESKTNKFRETSLALWSEAAGLMTVTSLTQGVKPVQSKTWMKRTTGSKGPGNQPPTGRYNYKPDQPEDTPSDENPLPIQKPPVSYPELNAQRDNLPEDEEVLHRWAEDAIHSLEHFSLRKVIALMKHHDPLEDLAREKAEGIVFSRHPEEAQRWTLALRTLIQKSIFSESGVITNPSSELLRMTWAFVEAYWIERRAIEPRRGFLESSAKIASAISISSFVPEPVLKLVSTDIESIADKVYDAYWGRLHGFKGGVLGQMMHTWGNYPGGNPYYELWKLLDDKMDVGISPEILPSLYRKDSIIEAIKKDPRFTGRALFDLQEARSWAVPLARAIARMPLRLIGRLWDPKTGFDNSFKKVAQDAATHGRTVLLTELREYEEQLKFLEHLYWHMSLENAISDKEPPVKIFHDIQRVRAIIEYIQLEISQKLVSEVKPNTGEESRQDGYIMQGDRAIAKFEKHMMISATNTYKDRVIGLLKQLLGSGIALSDAERYRIEDIMDRIGGEHGQISTFESLIEGPDDFVLGEYGNYPYHLHIAKDLLTELDTRGPPGTNLGDEYIIHELTCRVFGHYRAILFQQKLFSGRYKGFPDHYTDKNKLETQDPRNPYKGELGVALRCFINERHNRQNIIKPHFKEMTEYNFREPTDMIKETAGQQIAAIEQTSEEAVGSVTIPADEIGINDYYTNELNRENVHGIIATHKEEFEPLAGVAWKPVERVVGVLLYELDPFHGTIHIIRMKVKPDYKDRGIEAAFIEHLDELYSKDFVKVTADIYEHFDELIRTMHDCGFNGKRIQTRQNRSYIQLVCKIPISTAAEASEFRLPATYEECISLIRQGQDFSNPQAIEFISAVTKLVEDGRIPLAQLRNVKETLESNLNIDERQLTDTELDDTWQKFLQTAGGMLLDSAVAYQQSQLVPAWEALLLLNSISDDLNEFLESSWFENDATCHINFTTIVNQHKEELWQINKYIEEHLQVASAEEVDDDIAGVLVKLNDEHTEHSTMKLELFDAKTIISDTIKQLAQAPEPSAGEVRKDTVKGFADFYPALSPDNVQKLTADRTVYVTVDFNEPVSQNDIRLIVRPLGTESFEDIKATHINDYGSSHRFKCVLPENAKEYALEASSHPNSNWHWMGGTIKIARESAAAMAIPKEPSQDNIAILAANGITFYSSDAESASIVNELSTTELQSLISIINSRNLNGLWIDPKRKVNGEMYVTAEEVRHFIATNGACEHPLERVNGRTLDIISGKDEIKDMSIKMLESLTVDEKAIFKRIMSMARKFKFTNIYLTNSPFNMYVVAGQFFNGEPGEKLSLYIGENYIKDLALFSSVIKDDRLIDLSIRSVLSHEFGHLMPSQQKEVPTGEHERYANLMRLEPEQMVASLYHAFTKSKDYNDYSIDSLKTWIDNYVRRGAKTSGLTSETIGMFADKIMGLEKLHRNALLKVWRARRQDADNVSVVPALYMLITNDETLSGVYPGQNLELLECIEAYGKNQDQVSIMGDGLTEESEEAFLYNADAEKIPVDINYLKKLILLLQSQHTRMRMGSALMLANIAYTAREHSDNRPELLGVFKEAVPFLLANLDHDDATVRGNNANALGQLGRPLADSAIPKLKELLKAPEPIVHNSSYDVLVYLGFDTEELDKIAPFAPIVGIMQTPAITETAERYQTPSLLVIETGTEFEKELKPYLDSIRRLCEILSLKAKQPLLSGMAAIQEKMDIQVGGIAKKLGTILNNPAYDAEKIGGNRGLLLHALASTFVDRAGNALNDISPAMDMAVKNKMTTQEALKSIRASLDATDKIINGIKSIEEVRLSEGSNTIYIPGIYNIEHFPVVISSLTGETSQTFSSAEMQKVKAFKLAIAEATRIHTENLKYTPAIPEKTILCHIITDSILPDEQRNVLQMLEQDMRDSSYAEKVVRLSNTDPADFIKEVSTLMARQRDLYKDYTVKFDVACPSTDLVTTILNSGLGVKALAFEPCKEDAQLEGIIMALRALGSNNLDSLQRAFEFLSGNKLDLEKLGITSIDEFVKRVAFILPTAKEINYEDRRRLNDIIRENIKTAA